MVKLKKLFTGLLIGSVLSFAVSCQLTSEQLVRLYFADSQKMFFIPISTTIKMSGNIDEVSKPKEVSYLLEELKVSRDAKGLKTCIPEGVAFKDIVVDREKKEIDLTVTATKERLNDADEQLMVGALVNTLTDLNGIEAIKITPENFKSDMDYSEPITKDAYNDLWFSDEVIDEKTSVSTVYRLSKDKKYFVQDKVAIPKKDVTSLLKSLKKGPTGERANYLENSINPNIDIVIKTVNLNHIDIELKSKSQNVSSIAYETAKKAILLSIYDLHIFETIKIISPNSNGEIIDLVKQNPAKEINRVDFFVSNTKE